MSRDIEQKTLATMSALLEQGRNIDRLSCSMILGALVALTGIVIFGAAELVLGLMLALSILVGVINLYFSVRVGFDAVIFRQLATAKDGVQGLDDALENLGLLSPKKAGRPLQARIAGARRLFYGQILTTLLQVVLIFIGVIYAGLR